MSDEEPLVSTTTSQLEIYTADENLSYFKLGLTLLPINLVSKATTAPVISVSLSLTLATQA